VQFDGGGDDGGGGDDDDISLNPSHLLLLWRLKLSIAIRACWWWWACLIVNRTFEILLIVAVKAFYY
jgi:hypothetical protein